RRPRCAKRVRRGEGGRPRCAARDEMGASQGEAGAEWRLGFAGPLALTLAGSLAQVGGGGDARALGVASLDHVGLGAVRVLRIAVRAGVAADLALAGVVVVGADPRGEVDALQGLVADLERRVLDAIGVVGRAEMAGLARLLVAARVVDRALAHRDL